MRLANGMEVPDGVEVDLSPEGRARAMREAQERNDALVAQATDRWLQWRAGCGEVGEVDGATSARAQGLMGRLLSERGLNAWICGPTGSGKSMTAKALVSAWVAGRRGEAVRVSTKQVVEAVRSCFGGRGDPQRELDRWTRTGLLVLEQFEQAQAADWALSALHDLADARSEAALPTVVVCKLDPSGWYGLVAQTQQLAGMAEGIVSRLAGRCEVVRLAGPDRRLSCQGQSAS